MNHFSFFSFQGQCQMWPHLWFPWTVFFPLSQSPPLRSRLAHPSWVQLLRHRYSIHTLPPLEQLRLCTEASRLYVITVVCLIPHSILGTIQDSKMMYLDINRHQEPFPVNDKTLTKWGLTRIFFYNWKSSLWTALGASLLTLLRTPLTSGRYKNAGLELASSEYYLRDKNRVRFFVLTKKFKRKFLNKNIFLPFNRMEIII